MPVPVTAFTTLTPVTAKALDLALYTSDGTADNPTGIAFHAYRPILFEAYTRSTTFHGSAGGSTSTMSTSGSVSTCQVVYDTSGHFGQSADMPGAGYYAFTSAVLGSAGDGVTPGGWSVLAHFAPLKPTGTQTSVSADLLPVGGTVVSGSRQAPNTVNDSTPFFCDLQNVGSITWQPAVTIRDSGGSAAVLAVNTTGSSGETPRFYSLWAAVSATSSGSATYTLAGSYSFTGPPGVTQVTAAPTGAGAGGGAGNVSAGGVQFGGGGGGGAEYSLGTVAVTPGNIYPVTAGAAGVAGTSPGGNGGAGGNSAFSGDAATVTGHGGGAGQGATVSADGTAGAGGTGSASATHHDGGAGAAGTTAADGGGGGSSAGTGAAGNAAMGASPGSAPAGGGPGGAGGTLAIAVVQAASGSKTNASTFALNFPAPVQAGNTVVACVNAQSWHFTNPPSCILSDGAAMSSQQSSSVLGNGGVSANFAIFDIYSVTGGQTGVTVSNIGASNRAWLVQLFEISGLGPSPTIDTSASGSSQSSTYTASTVTSQAPEIWIGSVGTTKNSSHSISAASGWVNLAQLSATAGGSGGTAYARLRSGYQLVTAAGPMNYKGSLSGSIYWADASIAYASSAVTTGTAPLSGPGGGGGAGLGANNGAAGSDGAVTLTWTGISGSGYGTPPLPVPYPAWSPATAVGTTSAVDVNVNGSTGITGVLNFLSNPPTVRVSATAAQSIPSTTLTPVSFSGITPAVDSYSGWSSGTYTIQRSGLYLLHGLVCFAQAASGTRQAGVTINGTTYWGPGYTPASSGGTHATKTQVFSLLAGDTVQLACRQDSGGAVTLSTTSATRMFAVWLGLAGLPVQAWSPPDTTFRWAAGTPGSLLPGQLQTHLGNDLGFLCNRPYLLAYQGTAQSGLAVGSFSAVTLDTVAGIVHGDAADNYGGWTPGPANLYTAPCAGLWLIVGEYFATSSAASGATVAAGIAPSTSGGYSPAHTPDVYQQLTATSTASVGAGATVLGIQIASAGETIQPQVEALSYAAPYGTLTGTSNGGTYASHLEIVWCSE